MTVYPEQLELHVRRDVRKPFITVSNWWKMSPEVAAYAVEYFEANPEAHTLAIGKKNLSEVRCVPRLRQKLAAAYGAGQIKQAKMVGEYPPPDVLGTVTGRVTRSDPPFKEVPKWPQAYSMGFEKMNRIASLQFMTAEQARQSLKALEDADYSKLEERIAALMEKTTKCPR